MKSIQKKCVTDKHNELDFYRLTSIKPFVLGNFNQLRRFKNSHDELGNIFRNSAGKEKSVIHICSNILIYVKRRQ